MKLTLALSLAIAALTWLFWPTESAAERLLADYSNRLARTLETPIDLAPFQPKRLLSPLEQRKQAEPKARSSLGKVLSLGQCGLVQDLARVNNSLGKVAPASERLLMTQRLLYTAQQCTPEDPQIQAELDRLIEHRQALWPVLLNNALVAGPEWSAHFKSSTAPLGPRAPVDYHLDALLAWIDGQAMDQPDTGGQLNDLLQALNRSTQGGAALQAMALVDQQLPPMTQALQRSEICQGPRGVEQRRLAQQVFSSQYLERIQPWLSTLTKALRPIYAVPVQTPWRATPIPWAQWQTTTREHALAWRDLLGRCGLSPPGTG